MVLHNPEAIPRTSHPGVYKYAFRTLLNPENGVESIIDFGAGDNTYCSSEDVVSGRVTLFRVDAQYKNMPPRDDIYLERTNEWLSADVTNETAMAAIADNTFDVSISSFLFQHLSNEGMKKTLNQMRRVTKYSEGIESYIGNICIYPLFRQSRLKPTLNDHPEIVSSLSLYEGIEDMLSFSDFKYSTLVIRNDHEKQAELDEVVDRVVDSGALKRAPVMRIVCSIDKLLMNIGKQTYKKY